MCEPGGVPVGVNCADASGGGPGFGKGRSKCKGKGKGASRKKRGRAVRGLELVGFVANKVAPVPSESIVGRRTISAGSASSAGRTGPVVAVGRLVCSLGRLTPALVAVDAGSRRQAGPPGQQLVG